MASSKRGKPRTADRQKLPKYYPPSIVEDEAWLGMETHHCFYVEDNPPNLQSPTMKVLYDEYLRRIGVIIERARNGVHWQEQVPFARDTMRLGDWIYPERRGIISDDELLISLTSYGIAAQRAREIVGETHRKHRPVDPEVRLESIRAYDLYVRGETPAQIAKELYPKEFESGGIYPSRNTVERVRHRLRHVKNLVADLGLSITHPN